MANNLNFDELKAKVSNGEIDTILVCLVDMQGRLLGKRFHAQYFIDSEAGDTHACNYLLATDYDMAPVKGYKATSWDAGYGDYTMRPDLDTLCLMPWLEGTAMVLCDVINHTTHKEVAHSPRAILKRQVAKLAKMGLKPMMASELEFFLFNNSFEAAQKGGYSDLDLVSAYNEDYHIFQTTKEEDVMRAIRNGLYGAGITVECSKGEASAGQEEINVKYDEALISADNHVVIKNACKEIAWAKGKALTFMAKWNNASAGSSSHVHQSLWSLDGKQALFADKNDPNGMSELMQHYVAGLLKYAKDTTLFLAPNINSYKRFQEGTFAPTKTVWSLDNRTAGYRLCGAGSKAVRIECRVGGSDLNPYLAFAALLAAGIKGIEDKLTLAPAFVGDAYAADAGTEDIPNTLRAAAQELDKSTMLRAAFGDDVIDHYVHGAKWELQLFDQQVTDWEVTRGFENA
ncbi:MAG: glutamine synthetase [Rhizobiales bacterium]|nr:glutamine synthetase family protein [Hyphomicrobiales bacterium]NRB15381.1 glutamine synthetase [Hyphomicrobiales bacterium]